MLKEIVVIAGLLGICAAGSIPLAAQPAAIVQPLELETLVGAESANPQWGYGQQLGGFGGYGGYGGYGGGHHHGGSHGGYGGYGGYGNNHHHGGHGGYGGYGGYHG